MSGLLLYCLKLSICVAIAYGFYFAFLKKLTFFNWNRFYLLASSLLSFFIPWIDICDYAVSRAQKQILVSLPSVQELAIQLIPAAKKESDFMFSWPIAMETVIGLGIVFFVVQLLIGLFTYRDLLRRAVLIDRSDVRIYHLNEDLVPFSFGRSIFLNKNALTEKQFQDVVRHETVHAMQNHSFDIIFAEILCCLNWYNPFAWVLRKSIRQNLEFIADDQSLVNGSDKTHYQYLLLNMCGGDRLKLSNKFNFSSLKKRIKMMNLDRSKRPRLIVYGLILPLTAVLLMAFRSSIEFREAPKLSVNRITVPTLNKQKAATQEPVKLTKSRTNTSHSNANDVRRVEEDLKDRDTLNTRTGLSVDIEPIHEGILEKNDETHAANKSVTSTPEKVDIEGATKNFPSEFTYIKANSTNAEVKAFFRQLIENKYKVDITNMIFHEGKLQYVIGVLGGEPFNDSLTGPMNFLITNTNSAVLGFNPTTKRLYRYGMDGESHKNKN